MLFYFTAERMPVYGCGGWGRIRGITTNTTTALVPLGKLMVPTNTVRNNPLVILSSNSCCKPCLTIIPLYTRSSLFCSVPNVHFQIYTNFYSQSQYIWISMKFLPQRTSWFAAMPTSRLCIIELDLVFRCKEQRHLIHFYILKYNII